MGLEPAFSRHSWPVSGLAALPLEPDDPRLGIPRDALELNHRDAPEAVVLPASSPELEAAAGAPLVAAVKTLPLARKWKFALVASCVFHVAVAAFFMARGDEPVLIEGAQETGSVVLGNASQDDRAAGEALESELNVAQVTLLTMIEATPIETVDAREVANDAVAEAAATETLEPVEETPVAESAADPVETVTAQAAPQVMPDRSQSTTAEPEAPAAASDIVPEVLTSERNDPADENTVVRPQNEANLSSPSEATRAEAVPPAETAPATPIEAETVEPVAEAQAAPTEPPETVTVTETPVEAQPAEATADAQPSEAPVEAQPVETPETITAEMIPTPRPQASEEKPEPEVAEKRQEERKAEPKKAQPKAADKPTKPKETRTAGKAETKTRTRTEKGGGGDKGKTNATKGVANGERNGTGLNKGKGGKSGNGNAAVSNYPGKVTAKLRRAARGISRAVRRKAKNDVQVGFTISAGGGVSGVRITRSSGSPELDQMALAVVRRAAPFPPIPEGAGRSSWPFTMPLGF